MYSHNIDSCTSLAVVSDVNLKLILSPILKVDTSKDNIVAVFAVVENVPVFPIRVVPLYIKNLFPVVVLLVIIKTLATSPL